MALAGAALVGIDIAVAVVAAAASGFVGFVGFALSRGRRRCGGRSRPGSRIVYRRVDVSLATTLGSLLCLCLCRCIVIDIATPKKVIRQLRRIILGASASHDRWMDEWMDYYYTEEFSSSRSSRSSKRWIHKKSSTTTVYILGDIEYAFVDFCLPLTFACFYFVTLTRASRSASSSVLMLLEDDTATLVRYRDDGNRISRYPVPPDRRMPQTKTQQDRYRYCMYAGWKAKRFYWHSTECTVDWLSRPILDLLRDRAVGHQAAVPGYHSCEESSTTELI
jgi:hypothetical protein